MANHGIGLNMAFLVYEQMHLVIVFVLKLQAPMVLFSQAAKQQLLLLIKGERQISYLDLLSGWITVLDRYTIDASTAAAAG